MKFIKLITIFSVLALTALFILYLNPKPARLTEKQKIIKPAPSYAYSGGSTSLFVPYWTLNSVGENSGYNQYLYFGISVDNNGINKSDNGYLSLNDYLQFGKEDKNSLLVIRMLDSKTNFAVLKDENIQKKIISEAITIAKDAKFSGIVLNLELSALPFESLIKQINDFNKQFYLSAKDEKLEYKVTVYGDVYYRIRPFDVKTLAKYSDKIMIMAYDMHKASGNPGPNFPLKGKEKYGYDLIELVNSLQKEVSSEKIEVIFGLYGYDWLVDNKNISKQAGKALSFLEIKNTVLADCGSLNCKVTRDKQAQETQIEYFSADGKHLVWYEDMDSVVKKQEYLKSKGINNFSFWAHSYF